MNTTCLLCKIKKHNKPKECSWKENRIVFSRFYFPPLIWTPVNVRTGQRKNNGPSESGMNRVPSVSCCKATAVDSGIFWKTWGFVMQWSCQMNLIHTPAALHLCATFNGITESGVWDKDTTWWWILKLGILKNNRLQNLKKERKSWKK